MRKIHKRFWLISGILIWLVPFILSLIFKYINLNYSIVLFIVGACFFIRYVYEREKSNEEKENGYE